MTNLSINQMCNFLDLNPVNFLRFEKRKKKEDLFLFLLLYIFGMEKECRQPSETQF